MSKLSRGIYYRKKEKRYVGKCHAGRGEDNQIIYAYVYARSYGEVERKLEAKRLEVASMQNVRVHKDGSIKEWILQFVLSRVKVKQSTVTTYYAQAENHIIPLLGDIKVCRLTTEQVQGFVQTLIDKGLSAVTIKNIYGLLRMVMTKAEHKNMLHINPCKNIWLPAIEAKQTNPLTREEQAILEKTNDIAAILALFTGIRLGELCALRIENINLAKGTMRIDSTMQRVKFFEHGKKTKVIITVPKSKKSVRAIPLPSCVVGLLAQHITAKSGFLLTNCETPVKPRTLQNRFKCLLEKCSLAYTNFHALRHTFATRCLENNMDIKTLSEVLGHANASITMNIYCHSCDEHKRECMERLTLSRVA